MAATLDHETQAMGGREADGGRDVGGTLGRHHIDAGRRPPGVQPAGAFGEARLIGDIEGVGKELLRVGPAMAALIRSTGSSATNYIPNLSITLVGGIQPEPMRKVAGNSADDGLFSG